MANNFTIPSLQENICIATVQMSEPKKNVWMIKMLCEHYGQHNIEFTEIKPVFEI